MSDTTKPGTGRCLPDRNRHLPRRSGLPQHPRPRPEGGPACRATDGHLRDQPAHVRVLRRFSGCFVAGAARPSQVQRAGDDGGGNGDRDHLVEDDA